MTSQSLKLPYLWKIPNFTSLLRNSFVLSLLFSTLVTLVFSTQIPSKLDVDVEPIGPPLYENLNILYRFWIYYLMLLFPLWVGLFWVVIRKLFGERDTFQKIVVPVESPQQAAKKGRLLEVLSIAFTLLMPFGFFLLLFLSNRTGMWIQRTGVFHHYPWFPKTIAWPAFFLAETWALFLLYRCQRNGVSYLNACHKLFWFLLVPLLVGVINSYIPEPEKNVEYIHDVEAPLAAESVMKGGFPWRDYMTTAGTFHGLARGFIGVKLFEDSTWGVTAGHHLLYMPLYWIFLYFFIFQLIKKPGSFLLLAFLIFPFTVPRLFGFTYIRLTFYPVALGLLLAAFRKRSVLFSGLAAVMQTFLAIVTPEISFLLPASFVMLLGFEVSEWQKERRSLKDYRLTLTFALSVFVTLVVFFSFLYSNQALHSFLEYYQHYTRDAKFSRAFPIAIPSLLFLITVFIPPACYLYWSLTLMFKFGKRLPIASESWLKGAIALTGIFHYLKYLNQPDAHLYEPYIVVFPCVIWFFFKIFEKVEPLFEIQLGKHRLNPLFPLACVAFTTLTWPNRMSLLFDYRKFQQVSPPKTEFSRLGWNIVSPPVYNSLKDFKNFFSHYSKPEDPVWDVSGSPAFFYYLLEKKYPSPYIMSLEAHHESHAARIVKDIERVKPPFTILHSETSAWSTHMGVPIAVRNYHIRRYALQNYKPLLLLDGYLVMQRNDLNLSLTQKDLDPFENRASTKDLYFHTGSCDWKYAPNFMITPSAQGTPVDLALGPAFISNESVATPMRVPKHTNLKDYPYFEIELAHAGAERLILMDKLSDTPQTLENAITFQTLPRKTSFRLPVGSCGQWYTLKNETLYLRHGPHTQIVSARLTK